MGNIMNAKQKENNKATCEKCGKELSLKEGCVCDKCLKEDEDEF